MSNPEISVIVPIYKAEKYLTKCIESILSQTFSDFELLLINDGSPDSCGEICEEYAKKDKRIKVFHKNNGGVSSARNLGLNQATGKWVTFIDSDDFVDRQYFEYLLSGESEVELRVIGYHQQLYDGKWSKYSPKSNFFLDNSIQFFFDQYISSCLVRGPYCKLFLLNIIRSKGLQFNENLSYGEDFIFTVQYIENVRSICVVNYTGYYYAFNKDSLSSIVNSDGWELYIKEYEKVITSLLERYPTSYSISKDFANRRLSFCAVYMKHIYGEMKLKRKQRIGKLKEVYFFLKKNKLPYLRSAAGKLQVLLSVLYYLDSVTLADVVFSLLLKPDE